jgi:SAM-dependent methyltransferase
MSEPAFQDHFSGHAALYARVRPRYPAALFTWLAGKAPHRRLAWDAGTGNGQAAVALAAHFDRVVATDASERQIAEAEAHPSVEYRVAPAERSPVEAGSAALVTVAQAAHWFDLPAFFQAVNEALSPGGLVALWGYELMMVRPEVDAVVERLYGEIVGPYWPAERALVEGGYRTIDFPFQEVRPPMLQMEQSWDLAALFGYLRSWSATQRYAVAKNSDPVLIVANELAAAWGDPATVRPVRFPLFLRIGRAPA